jgi:mono/diheme cytochrome c family protein
MRRLLVIALAAACTGDTAATSDTRAAPTPIAPATFGLGAPVDSAQLAMLDIDASPSGASLPPGGGDAAKGATVYAAKCASCHGPKGEGVPPASKLVGRDPREGFPFGRDPKLGKTVGNYWPYATTVFDYVRRAMPLTAPGTLSPEEVYAVTAWILAENEIIPRDSEMNARTLPAVKMPAAGRFVVDDRKGTTVR